MGRQAFLSYFKEGILQLPRRIEENHKERPGSGSPGFCPRLPGTFIILNCQLEYLVISNIKCRKLPCRHRYEL